MALSDPIADMTETLLRHGIDPGLLRRVAREVRARWGGAEIYVRAIDPDERDRVAREALEHGASIEQAAHAAECSPSTIRRRRSRWL